jgi:hypothetical protein
MGDTMMFRCGLILASAGWLTSCGGGNSTGPTAGPTAPTDGRATVVISYRAPTRPRTDLPPSAQACVTGVGETHVHTSWRDYVALRAAATERWEVSLNDAPVGSRLTLVIHDGNACDGNPTGNVQHNVFVNDVLLTQTVTVTTTGPGAGPEPGLVFSVDASGRVTP